MGLSQTAWVLIAFILFFVLVGKKLWSALNTNLDQRKKMIENELNEAKKLREEAQAMKQMHEVASVQKSCLYR